MIYLFSHRWGVTTNNHAGFHYLCNTLEERWPEIYRNVDLERKELKTRWPKHLIPRMYNRMKRELNKVFTYLSAYRWIKRNSGGADVVLLTEYLLKMAGDQGIIAKAMRKNYKGKIFAICHLCNSEIDNAYSVEEIKKYVALTDGIITLGSSLSSFLCERGLTREKIHTTFHYIDEYYLEAPPSYHIDKKQRLKVLVSGNHLRDMDTLEYIVNNVKDMTFVICQGLMNMSDRFKQDNVILKSYMEEAQLKNLMHQCAISLNCMVDTIGSNVIVTSMGMGLAMVCSDVGSIRDYCSSSNTFFCKEPEEFVNALRVLNDDRSLLAEMRESAHKKAFDFKIEKFHKDLTDIVSRIQ